MKQRSVMGCRVALYEPGEDAPPGAFPVYVDGNPEAVLRAKLIDEPTGWHQGPRGAHAVRDDSVLFTAVLRHLGRGWRANGWRAGATMMIVVPPRPAA